MKIGLPAGIGDASWIVSKLINAPEWNELEIEISDGWPYRVADYFKMLGKKITYDMFNYEEILIFERLHPYKNWSDIVSNGFGRFLMQPNSHLEGGRPLAEYLPDLETSYHYPLKTPSIKKKRYYEKLSRDRWIGISAASYRGHKAWNTWPMFKWKQLCKMLIKEGYNICLMGGSWDDLTRALSYELGENCLNLVGETSFSEACSVHKMVSFFIGFSSGLGIVRTVLGLPTIMIWPDHLQALSTSWADPEDVKSKKYIASSYMKVRGVFDLFKIQASI